MITKQFTNRIALGVSIAIFSICQLMPQSRAETAINDKIIDDCDVAGDWTGASVGFEIKEGAGSLFAENPMGKQYAWSIYRGLEEESRNWSGYHYLTFWVYNAQARTQKFYVTLSSIEALQSITEFPHGNAPDYYYAAVDLDFEGWKKVILELGQFSEARNTKGWDSIGAISFSMGHIGGPQDGDYAGITIDDIRLTNSPDAQ